VPACGFCVLGWASASDTVRTVGDTAKLNAASPTSEKTLRREIISVFFCSVTSNPPYLIVATRVVNAVRPHLTAPFHSLLKCGLALKR
jgi:hypothetical protein